MTTTKFQINPTYLPFFLGIFHFLSEEYFPSEPGQVIRLVLIIFLIEFKNYKMKVEEKNYYLSFTSGLRHTNMYQWP